MKSWKVWVPAAAAGSLVVVALVVWAVMRFSDAIVEPVEAADKFLALIGQGKISEAYNEAAPALRNREDLNRFTDDVKAMGLAQYESSSFPRVNIKSSVATIDGSFTRRGGGSVPLTVTLTLVGDTWRVFALKGPVGGVTIGNPGAALDRTARASLARQTLRGFNSAAQSGDFGAFHATLSKPFQDQFTADRLKTAFKQFVDRKIDLTPMIALDPEFNAAQTGAQRGQLRLAGHFPSTPSRLIFDLKYIAEGGRWKLLSINVNVKPVDG